MPFRKVIVIALTTQTLSRTTQLLVSLRTQNFISRPRGFSLEAHWIAHAHNAAFAFMKLTSTPTWKRCSHRMEREPTQESRMFTGSFQLRASSVPRLRARQLCYSVASALMTNICVNLGHFQHRQDVPTLRISVMVLGMYGGGLLFCIQIKTRFYCNT